MIDQAVDRYQPGFLLYLGALIGLAVFQLFMRAVNRWLFHSLEELAFWCPDLPRQKWKTPFV